MNRNLGLLLGGLMVAWAGYLPVFVINAGSYLFSGGFESFIRLPAIDSTAADQTDIVDDILEGCRYVVRRKRLMVILVMVGVIHFFVGSIEAVIPVLAIGNISIPLAILTVGILMEYVPHSVIAAASGLILLPTSLLAYHKYMQTLSDRRQGSYTA